jgi:hypothetical protein
MPPIDFHDNPNLVRQQQKEVHALALQFAGAVT